MAAVTRRSSTRAIRELLRDLQAGKMSFYNQLRGLPQNYADFVERSPADILQNDIQHNLFREFYRNVSEKEYRCEARTPVPCRHIAIGLQAIWEHQDTAHGRPCRFLCTHPGCFHVASKASNFRRHQLNIHGGYPGEDIPETFLATFLLESIAPTEQSLCDLGWTVNQVKEAVMTHGWSLPDMRAFRSGNLTPTDFDAARNCGWTSVEFQNASARGFDPTFLTRASMCGLGPHALHSKLTDANGEARTTEEVETAMMLVTDLLVGLDPDGSETWSYATRA